MSELLCKLFHDSLPNDLRALLADRFTQIDSGNFESLLRSRLARIVFGHDQLPETEQTLAKDSQCWTDDIFHRLGLVISAKHEDAQYTPEYLRAFFFLLGYTSLLAFLQSNYTGPPLPFDSAKTLFGDAMAEDQSKLSKTRSALIDSLSVDGVAAYKLTPNVELLCLADTIFSCPPVRKNVPLAAWAQLRTNFIHQRILSEQASTLQEQIYSLTGEVETLLESKALPKDAHVSFLLEKASIETYYSNDRLARAGIDKAARERKFQFAITGRLGKRTKFQQKDTSQLVVLAKSFDTAETTTASTTNGNGDGTAPKNLDLNDDTLLESISFTTLEGTDPAKVIDESALTPALASLDVSAQPILQPLDSVILLALASAITNTSPADGLTREETLPYATRVLEGGSSNWQIYTQALLVRSRIEGYKSRTIERGLLQLQALVDQVIVDTTPAGTNSSSDQPQTSFLPRPSDQETAPVSQRLQYIFPLSAPSRWDLESELAQRWVSLGGLRSALEIYTRLELWAEVALCWAATQREDKARSIVRKLLYQPTPGTDADAEDQTFSGPELDPLPADAPRLFCILADIDSDIPLYQRAWTVSGKRYARAQRSLGRLYFSQRDHLKAAEAYSLSLNVNKLNQASWFALGCCLLELEQFKKAVEAFTRCVQLDERDAEAWSNLAAAMLRCEDQDEGEGQVEGEEGRKRDPQKFKRDALRALKRAASLKGDSHRIWENVMVVAVSLDPPDLASVVAAQSRIVDLRGKTDGEKCVDAEILGLMVGEVTRSGVPYDATKPGAERLLVELVEKKVQPLITGNAVLWGLVGKLAFWRAKWGTALEAQEKAWRVVTSQPGWEADEKRWDKVVDATVELCEAYESLGPKERTEGLGAGELVAKDWRFKARSAIRTVMGRGKEMWEGSSGWDRLRETMDGLKA
ncbi:hypothetical protein BDZ85DRAFT_46526 [Elsinoe ampelina]|uniref:Uncharacterized protein n=1 Tax=Elsinoe ampelina TaxID=302913 RepID=A0A6A6G0I0_9PEZI|nr:hypothetical protein BDZ85DRAFT_46526 [Elsinoe ampelina]